MMKIVVTIATIDLNQGGPARTVPALCRALVSCGVDLELITIAENGRAIRGAVTEGFAATVVATPADRYHPHSWAKQFKEALRKAVSPSETVIYDVGLWLPSNHFVARIAEETNTRLVISPRGMMSKHALRYSKWKKRAAWILYQRRDLDRACVLHATSHEEVNEFRALKLTQPVAVVPNGVEIPVGIEWSTRFRERASDNKQSKILLFLSRLHPKKGLRDLVAAWARVRPKGWRAVIAGPNENNHQEEIESLAESLGVRSEFDFIGPVNDSERSKLLSQSNLFVLPSYSENFGMAIAEALASGVPVITTKATPWREIEMHRSGWWVDTGDDSIARALSSATACSGQELREMGIRGHELIRTKYSWDVAARELMSVFKWTLGKAKRPACVL